MVENAQMQTMNGDGGNYSNWEKLDHLFWCTGGLCLETVLVSVRIVATD